MKNILFCISNHGFGHLMRNLTIIEYLLKNNKKIVVMSGRKQLIFLREHLLSKFLFNSNCILVESDNDFGLRVKKDKLELDYSKIIAGVTQHVAQFPYLIAKGKKIIQQHNITHVVSDITPWILVAAKELGVKSTLMASFTWLDIYEEFLPAKLLQTFQDCYADAQQVLFYDLANPKTIARFSQGTYVGLSARPVSKKRVAEIKAHYAQKGKMIVFMSVGASNSGVKSSYDVSKLPYNFIVTAGISLKGSNVEHLPLDVLDTQNYIAASDYCISKAGWTSISEMLLSKRPVALLRRDDNAEDRYLIQELERRKQAIAIDLEDLADLNHVLEKMRQSSWSVPEYHNDYQQIVNLILND